MVRVTSRVTLFSLLIASSSGCLGNVNYVPRDDDRLRLGIRGGRFLYVRDGLAIGEGWFGSGLVSAVVGVPRAEVAAQRSRNALLVGSPMRFFGEVCLGGIAGYVLGESSFYEPYSASPVIIGTAAICAGLAGTGVWMERLSQRYRNDAVNEFNAESRARDD